MARRDDINDATDAVELQRHQVGHLTARYRGATNATHEIPQVSKESQPLKKRERAS